MNQLSLLIPTAPPAPGNPVSMLVHAAKSISFTTKIVRSRWGVGIGKRRKWVLKDSEGCCALGAYLIATGAEVAPFENTPRDSVRRLLAVSSYELDAFIRGFDGNPWPEPTVWFDRGQTVARELGL